MTIRGADCVIALVDFLQQQETTTATADDTGNRSSVHLYGSRTAIGACIACQHTIHPLIPHRMKGLRSLHQPAMSPLTSFGRRTYAEARMVLKTSGPFMASWSMGYFCRPLSMSSEIERWTEPAFVNKAMIS